MRDFTNRNWPSEETLDVKNPLYDLLIKDEELYPAAERMQEDLTHISSRLNSLEDNHPARESLQDEVNTVMKERFDVDRGLDAIASANRYLGSGELVNTGALFVGSYGSAIAAPLAVSAVATGPIGLMIVAAPMLGASGLLTYEGLEDSLEAAQHMRSLVNDYLDMAARMHVVREDFDELWVRLVESEDQDQLPAEE